MEGAGGVPGLRGGAPFWCFLVPLHHLGALLGAAAERCAAQGVRAAVATTPATSAGAGAPPWFRSGLSHALINPSFHPARLNKLTRFQRLSSRRAFATLFLDRQDGARGAAPQRLPAHRAAAACNRAGGRAGDLVRISLPQILHLEYVNPGIQTLGIKTQPEARTDGASRED